MARKSKSLTSSLLFDLKELARLLGKYKFDQNNRVELTNLEKEIDRIETDLARKDKGLFHFSVTNDNTIVFHSLTTGMTPNPATEKNTIDLVLSLSYVIDSNKDTTPLEMVSGYSLNLFIECIQKNHRCKHFFEWHLDGPEKEVNKKKGKHHFIHPVYHIHAGGASLKEKGPGSLIMLTSPRLPYPPMDIVLAVNFIICNFFSTRETAFKKEVQILDDEDYQALVKRAADRLYQPYFSGINTKVHDNVFAPLFTT